MSNIATKWRALSGEEEWKGLLDPLDLDLRRMIIHYGERVQAISDAFINDEKSKNCGLSRYAKRHLFSEVGLEKGNPYEYEVTTYFYATTGISTSSNGFIKKSIAVDPTAGDSNWMGYVAVSTDRGTTVLGRRDILIAWKGIEELAEDGPDLESDSEIFGKGHSPTMVHSGCYSMYTKAHGSSGFNSRTCRMQVLDEVKRRVYQYYKNEEVSITVAGYSSGAAMAILNAVDIVQNGFNEIISSTKPPCLVTAFGFGVPRVGNKEFSDEIKKSEKFKNLRVLRINNKNDPHVFPNVRRDPFLSDLDTVGVELTIDTSKSPYLKVFPDDSKEAKSIAHNLEVHLHGVATHGDIGNLKLGVNREIALVNKWSNALRDEHLVLDNWWTAKNKSMVQNEDGSWVLMDTESDANLI